MEEWTPFRAALIEKGCLLWVHSGSRYRVTDPDAPDLTDPDDTDDFNENDETPPAGAAQDTGDAFDEAARQSIEQGNGDEDADFDDELDEELDDNSQWGLPGIYAAVGAPAGMSPKELDGLLTALTKDWKHPLSWLALAKAAGGNEKRHLEIMEKYGL